MAKKKRVTAIYSYRGTPDAAFDKALIKFAERKGGGEWAGAGCGFGARDVEFDFVDAASARKLMPAIRQLAKEHKIGRIELEII
jgi:hypothetical protein